MAVGASKNNHHGPQNYPDSQMIPQDVAVLFSWWWWMNTKLCAQAYS